jgi:2-methylisocitrate lyase-like PEP mutase family enzyme
MKHTSLLRNMLTSRQLIIAPGVYNGLSALLAKRAGFSVLYASGGAISRSAGYPDIGLLSLTEVLQTVEHIVNASNLPVIADADTGFGNAINVWRTVRDFESIGVAGLHLEDQTFPKRCGHLNDKSIISLEEMCHKLKVAKKAIKDPDFLLIARTDAIAIEGIESAIHRAKAYLQAGAEVIFIEAPETYEQIELIAERIHEPKLINMFSGGKTPLVPTARLQELGYSMVIIPSDVQRAAIKAMQNALNCIAQNGNTEKMEDQMVTFQERELIVNTASFLEMDQF